MLLDKADVLATYKNWEVHSPNQAFPVPAVMLEREYIKVSRNIKYSRDNIYLRDLYTCQYCGLDCYHFQNTLTIDHVIPRARGGKSKWDNVVAACKSCNLEKAHYMKMKPISTPKRPSYHELSQKIRLHPMIVPDESWIDFLGMDPALVTVKPPKNRPGILKPF